MTDLELRALLIQHFQSHGETKLSFAPITVIRGPNDCGKTAILRAFCALSFNDPMDIQAAAIQSGSPATIQGIFSDGRLSRRRKEDPNGNLVPGSNALVLRQGDGKPQTIRKFRGGYPDYVRAFLRMDPVLFEGSEPFSLNVHLQDDGPFLIGPQYSGTTRAKVLGAINDQHKFDLVARDFNLERKQLDAEAKVLASLLDQEREKLASLAQEPNYRRELDMVERTSKVIAHMKHRSKLGSELLREQKDQSSRAVVLACEIAEGQVDPAERLLALLAPSQDRYEEGKALLLAKRRQVLVARELEARASVNVDALGHLMDDLTDSRTKQTGRPELWEQYRNHSLRPTVSVPRDPAEVAPIVAAIDGLHARITQQRGFLDEARRWKKREKAVEQAASLSEAEVQKCQKELLVALERTHTCPFWNEVEFQAECRSQYEKVSV